MVYVTQGTMRNIRNDMFKHMESLPIKYFDTHKPVSYTHLDIIIVSPGQLHAIGPAEYSMEYENIIFSLDLLCTGSMDCLLYTSRCV